MEIFKPIIAGVACCALPSCVTSLESIRARPPFTDTITAASVDDVKTCLIEKQQAGLTPVVFEHDGITELMFRSEAAGIGFDYQLTAVKGGTRVVLRRKNAIAPGIAKASTCYN